MGKDGTTYNVPNLDKFGLVKTLIEAIIWAFKSGETMSILSTFLLTWFIVSLALILMSPVIFLLYEEKLKRDIKRLKEENE
jgi:hypothetical protein